MNWTAADSARITQLREQQTLTDAERAELRELRYRETIEATRRRIAYFKGAR